MESELFNRWTVVAFDFKDPGSFNVIYKGENYNEAQQALVEASYEFDHIRLEFYA